jgi:hypothetical protein
MPVRLSGELLSNATQLPPFQDVLSHAGASRPACAAPEAQGHHDWHRYQSVVMLGGGIGVSAISAEPRSVPPICDKAAKELT